MSDVPQDKDTERAEDTASVLAAAERPFKSRRVLRSSTAKQETKEVVEEDQNDTDEDDDEVDETAVKMSTAVVESMITVLRQSFLQKSALQTSFEADILMPKLGDKGQFTFKDFQEAGVKWLLFNYFTGTNCILADEMGLGKTVQVIGFLAWLIEGGRHTRNLLDSDKQIEDCVFSWPHQPQFIPPIFGMPSLATNLVPDSNLPLALGPNASGPHLIVVPPSLVENWQREISRFYPSAKVVTVAGSAKARKEIIRQLMVGKQQVQDVNIFLTSYKTVEAAGKIKSEEVPEWFQLLGAIGRPFVTMTLDEGHTLKSARTAVYKTLHGTPALFRLLLTGTPIQNNVDEVVNLMAFLSVDVMLRAMSEYAKALGKGHGRKFATEPCDLHAWNEIMEDNVIDDALKSLAESLSRWITSASSKDVEEAASAHAAIAASEGVSVATAAALEKAATAKLSGLLDLMLLRRTKDMVLKQVLPPKDVLKLNLGMTADQKLWYQAATRCLREPDAFKPVARSGAGADPPAESESQGLPFIATLTDIVHAGEKYSGNAMAILRKLASHPLLARVHYTDEDIVAFAARMQHSEKPGSVSMELLGRRKLKIGPHMMKESWPGPATRESLLLMAKGNKTVARIAERMLDFSDFKLHQIAIDEEWDTMQLPDKCFLNSNKIQFLLDLLAKTQSTSKIVVFSQFTTVLDLIEAACDLKGVSRVRLDGSTAVPERMIAVDRFQNDPSVRLFLASTKAGGVGLNLTAAKYAVLLDPDFNPTNDAQCEDRIHRIGQEQRSTVIKVAAKDTIETHIAKIAARKTELQGAVLAETDANKPMNSKDEEREALRQALFGDDSPP